MNTGFGLAGKGLKKKLANIFQAVQMGDLNRVNQLLQEEGVDPNVMNENGQTPLHLAAQSEMGQLVDALLANGSSTEITDTLNGYTPLHYATTTKKGTGRVVAKELIDIGGADINAESWDGDTPMHVASRIGSEWAVEDLIGKGANMNAQNDEGFTPMHFAALEGKVDVLNTLQQHGADINCRSVNGSTPIHCAAAEGHSTALDFLVKSGADVNAVNDKGLTATGIAELMKNAKLARNLKKIGGQQPPELIDKAKRRMAEAMEKRQKEREKLLRNMVELENSRKPIQVAPQQFLTMQEPVSSILVNANLMFVAASSMITAWDLDSLQPVQIFSGHTADVTCMTFDEDLLYSGSLDATVRSWDVQTGECTSVMEGHTDAIHAMVAYEGMLYSASNHDMRAWDIVHSQICVFLFSGHVTNKCCIQLYEEQLYSAELDQETWGGIIKVFNITDGSVERVYKTHGGAVMCMSIVEDVIWTGDDNGAILALDLHTGEELTKFVRGGAVYSSIYIDQEWIMAGTSDGIVDQWNRELGALIYQHHGSTTTVHSLIGVGDQDSLYLSAVDPLIKLATISRDIPPQFTKDGDTEVQDQSNRLDDALYGPDGEVLKVIIKCDFEGQRRKMEVPMDLKHGDFLQTLAVAYGVDDDLIISYEDIDGELRPISDGGELISAFHECIGTGPNGGIKRLLVLITTETIQHEKEMTKKMELSSSQSQRSLKPSASTVAKSKSRKADAVANKLLKLDSMKRRRMKKYL